MTTQHEKAAALRALHDRDGIFVIANAWDAGSAKLLAAAGFEAIATTSAGFAYTLGMRDNTPGRDAVLRNAADIVAAVDLPVSADLENGFGDDPETVAETIRLASETGLAGGSIEDSTQNPEQPLYDTAHAAERIAAAVEAARALPCDFVLTARAENYLVGRPDIDDVIQRLQAYQEAGADCLYAPGLKQEADIRAVLAAVDRPVNVIMGLAGGPGFTVASLAEMGVRRISVGSAFARQAYGGLLEAAREVRSTGRFDCFQGGISNAELNKTFSS